MTLVASDQNRLILNMSNALAKNKKFGMVND